MTERDKFNEWARFHTFDNMQALTAAWIAWQARAELAETELVRITMAHRSNVPLPPEPTPQPSRE